MMMNDIMEALASSDYKALGALLAGVIVFFIVIAVISYVYASLTLMFTARKLKEENDWLAWIPVGNLVLMSKMAKMHWWPVLLLAAVIIPFINILAILTVVVFNYIWWWKIVERRNILPPWTVLLTLVPYVGGIWSLVLWGMLAWKE